jgi:hypothetical protein
MLMRFASVISVVSLMACLSPTEQAKEQSATSVVHAGELSAGHSQTLTASWSTQFADQNKCAIQGFQPGTDAFAQCVRTTIEQQSRPHRCTYCRSLD